MSLCKNVEFVCEVMLQLLCCYLFDVVILFSDILIIFDVMGLGFYFEIGEGLKFECLIFLLVDVKKILNIDLIDEFGYVMNVVSMICCELKGEVLLIGFFGLFWIFVIYMVEGGSSKIFGKIKKMVFVELQILYLLFDKLVDLVIDYLNV